MKDLMSKDHYCYKIHTLLMNSSASPPSIDNPSYMDSPPVLTRKSLPLFYDFSKVPPSINKGGGLGFTLFVSISLLPIL